MDVVYANDAGTAKDVTIRTNGGTLTVNAPNDTVNHYNEVESVTITAVADNSYHEYGEVSGVIEVTQGRVVLESGSSTSTVYVTGTDVTLEWSGSATPGEVALSDSIDAGDINLPAGSDDIVTGGVDESIRNLFAGGFGTEKSPYIIETAAQFANIGQLSDEMIEKAYHFRLNADIDLREADASFSQGYLTRCFQGVLDGNGHTIASPAIGGGILIYANTGDTVLKNFEVIQRGGSNNENLILLAYGNLYNDAYGAISFENIRIRGIADDTIIEEGTNSSSFVAHCRGAVRFVNCINDVNLNVTQYAGIFIGGYIFKNTEDLQLETELTFIGCVNLGTVSGYSIGFFTGNPANQPITQIVQNEDFSDKTDPTTAAAYIENCRNNGVILHSGSYGAFAAGAWQDNAANAEANAALQGQTDKYDAGTVISIETSAGLAYKNSEQGQNLMITKGTNVDTEYAAATYDVSFSVSLSYLRPNGGNVGSSYFMVTVSGIAAADADNWTMRYATSFKMEADNATYDGLESEILKDDRGHEYKYHLLQDGTFEIVVDYDSVVNDGMLENSAGTATIGNRANYQIIAKNQIGQIVGIGLYNSNTGNMIPELL